ncbi:MAG TPA: twin-arginine translocase TatA/TatE family subunit [Blastocatellia bacterium]
MGLGMPEVILILVIALIVFGPRKLPELGKSLGQAMTQFRRASDDFKRTWEQEVETEKYRKGETASSSSSNDYSSSSSYGDSYNPYGSDTESGATSSTAGEKQNESTATDSSTKPESVKTEVAAAGAGTGVNGEPKPQHWI